METFAWTLAAALVAGLAALAIQKPRLYIRLVTPGFLLCGFAMWFGLGRLTAAGSYAVQTVGGAILAMGYLYVLAHLATASLNAQNEHEADERSKHHP